MKIGVEAEALFRTHKTGVDFYTGNLFRSLFRIDGRSQYSLATFSELVRGSRETFVSFRNVGVKSVPFPKKLYSLSLRIPLPIPFDLLAGIRPDVFIFPNFVRFPLIFGSKTIVIIHDLAFVDMPETLIPRHQRFLSRAVPRSLSKADHIIAISEHTKTRIKDRYGIRDSRISVITPAVDHSIFRPVKSSEVAGVRKKFGIKKEYLLYLGTLEPRKNIEGIIAAYKNLPEGIRDSHQLVLAGGKGWLEEDIERAIKSLPAKNLITTGYVEDRDKSSLYSGAKIFLYPSHYEGWGIQILEAMACGTPVITARNSSLEEVGGNAAFYIEEATDSVSLSRSISEVLNDATLRKEMISNGFDHASRFSWDRSAKKLLDIISRI